MEKLQRKDLIIEMLLQEPNDIFLNYALAMEHISTSDFLIAEAQLRKMLTIEAEYLPCYFQLGQLNEKLDNAAVAISFYQKGLELAKKQGNTKAAGELNEALWMLED